jgi:hypothetical protein
MTFLIIIAVIVGIIALFYKKAENDVSKEDKAKVAMIADKANQYLSKIDSAKTTSSKINNCEKALETLYQAEQFPGCREVIEDYDILIDKIQRVKKVLPVGKYLEKAQKHNFKGKDSSEKNSLLDALYEVRTNNITNQDFEVAELHDDQTGEIVTVQLIENRLRDLGWDGDSQITR